MMNGLDKKLHLKQTNHWFQGPFDLLLLANVSFQIEMVNIFSLMEVSDQVKRLVVELVSSQLVVLNNIV